MNSAGVILTIKTIKLINEEKKMEDNGYGDQNNGSKISISGMKKATKRKILMQKSTKNFLDKGD